MSSTSRGSQSQNNNHNHNHNNNNPPDSMSKAIAQYTVDARLHAAFEQSGVSGKSFDYSESIRTSTIQSFPEQQITAYLSKIQRGGLIQPFGCMIAIDESSYRVIAYSENAKEMLGINPHTVPSLELERPQVLMIGVDVRTLFMSSSVVLLEKALGLGKSYY